MPQVPNDTLTNTHRVILHNVLQAQIAAFEQCKSKVQAVLANMEPAMRLNIDVRNDLLDSISNLKFQPPLTDE